MIPFNFEYYKPETVEEAVGLFKDLKAMGKEPIYYGGGTEFISMARMHNVCTKAVIDIKGIAECNIYEIKNNELVIGSAVTLTTIAELNFFPLLSLTVKRIADHTVQDKITLGGNLAGTIIYHEAVMPIMVADGEIIIANVNGKRKIHIKDIFNQKIQLNEGEMIVQVIIDNYFLSQPYIHVKRTKNEKIDYPLISMAALKNNDQINITFSGLYQYPFRDFSLEHILNDKLCPINERINRIINNISGKILNDISGSAEYRKFMLRTMLHEVLEKLQ